MEGGVEALALKELVAKKLELFGDSRLLLRQDSTHSSVDGGLLVGGVGLGRSLATGRPPDFWRGLRENYVT